MEDENAATSIVGDPSEQGQGEASYEATEVAEAAFDERAAALKAAEAELEARKKEFADKERLAAVEAKQREVEEREDSFKEQDEVIDNYQSGKKAKPGQSFIDNQGRQHAGNCNSHPAKRKQFPCDCGKNGTARYKPQQ